MTDKKTEALKLALKKAFDLGKRYWQQANSDFTSQWRKADVTLASFNQLVEDTIREALAEQPAQPSKPWVGLTDVEWMNIVNKDHAWFGQRPEEVAHEVAKLVEAKLREKNS